MTTEKKNILTHSYNNSYMHTHTHAYVNKHNEKEEEYFLFSFLNCFSFYSFSHFVPLTYSLSVFVSFFQCKNNTTVNRNLYELRGIKIRGK